MIKMMNFFLVKSLFNLIVGIYVIVNMVMFGLIFIEGVEKMLEDMYVDLDIFKEDWEKDFMKNYCFCL